MTVSSALAAGEGASYEQLAAQLLLQQPDRAGQVDQIEITAVPGDIVIAPAGAPHQFVNTGDEELRLTAIHPASEMSTQWLAPARSEEPAAGCCGWALSRRRDTSRRCRIPGH
jgi:oxalate decarboxylase/phosphoglucose isomerase-like protein (cupin superfamily)